MTLITIGTKLHEDNSYGVMSKKSKSQSGFSLLELLIVVAVIAIIASLAIPNLQSSKRAAYEAAAISYMRSWTSGQELYLMRHGTYADADNQLVGDGFIANPDPDAQGYTFSIDNGPGSATTWWGQGWPTTPGVTGDRYFFIDSSGVIRWSLSGNASATSPPLGDSGP